MPLDTKIWKISTEDKLTEMQRSKLNLEDRIVNWIVDDISILSDDLLVIGREVETGFGGFIDILCLDNNGDTAILELKRDKTPRDITAQVMDYASWAVWNELSYSFIKVTLMMHLKKNLVRTYLKF